MAISFKHPTTGLIKECPEGFSWTTFFFNAFVPLFRGQWGPFLITMFTGGLAGYYYMFKINKIYATHLLEKGFAPASDLDFDKIKMAGIHIASPEGTKQVEQTEEKEAIAS